MRALHNTQLCSNRPVTEAGLPAEGTAGCMSVLLCRRAGEFQQRVMAVSVLGPVGQGLSALCSAHPRAAEPRACQDVDHFHVGWASARAEVPSDVPRAPAVQARPEMRSCLRAYPRKQRRASARTVVPSHQALARGAKRARVLQAGYPAPVRIDGNRVSALRTCVLEMREAGGELISIRLWHQWAR